MSHDDQIKQTAAGLIRLRDTQSSAEKIYQRMAELAKLNPENELVVALAAELRERLCVMADLRAYRAHKRGGADLGVRKLRTEVGV